MPNQSLLFFFVAKFSPSKIISPFVIIPLDSNIPVKDLIKTDFPEPDSPTIASVSPLYKSKLSYNFILNTKLLKTLLLFRIRI